MVVPDFTLSGSAKSDSASRAEKKIAAAFLLDLDVEIDPIKLGDFIRRRWHRISPLAHIIHGLPPADAAGAREEEPDNG